MQFAKPFLYSMKARMAGAAFGAVAALSMFAAVVITFAAASGELDPVVAMLQPGSRSAEAVVSLAKLKAVEPVRPSASLPAGKPGSG